MDKVTWNDLDWWSTTEWQTIQFLLNYYDEHHLMYNPSRQDMFRALDLVDLCDVSVAIFGQDPYPDSRFATGLAFDVPEDTVGLPRTLETMYEELGTDLNIIRRYGSLEGWCRQGVLLWNVIPTCTTGLSLSHDWPEYKLLTNEITEELCKQGIVFVLLGGKARSFVDIINYYDLELPGDNKLIELCHPSPRANANAKTDAKFIGSRMFSRINDHLVSLGRNPIDWRL